MENKLVDNEQFLRIRKLNSTDERRQSIIADKDEMDVSAEISVEEAKKAKDGQKVAKIEVPYNEVEKDELPDEEHIKLRLKRIYNGGDLNGPEKRYSFFGDVAFEYRPSVLDGAINDPIKLHFEGPTLEKQLRENREIVKLKGTGQKDEIIFKSQVLQPNFSGLYVLFWTTVAFLSVKVTVNYYYEHGRTFRDSAILEFMTKDVLTVALVDFVMYLNMYFVFIVHCLCKKKIMTWSRSGILLTSVFEFFFMIFYLYLPEGVLKLHWVAKIFLFLHSLVLLMKMHSYAFYNGYMWNILEELNFSSKHLGKQGDISDPKIVTVLERSRNFCKSEIESQSHSPQNLFPKNINFWNFFMYTMYPTLVYQIEYPRTPRVRWGYVAEKICAIFGIIFVMMVLAQTHMYPLALEALALRDMTWLSFPERLKQWGFILLDYIPPFIGMYLLVFYLIWDAILNCIAELTRFGDRYFYGDWWNCVSWDEFSRIWNVPVHKFLLRHVYHSSMSALQLNKIQATLMTFFLSSVVHELSMYVLFKKLRFYLFFFQMAQLPLVALGNSKFLKRKTVLGNVVFWIGICTGPSVLCTMYLTF
ncbi:related to Sterol O-acyltransferase 2 [Zygosaccharomyces bailii]|nr:related to Sterol O-acyltransferase 2 [Zygosaccharomyces bailii]